MALLDSVNVIVAAPPPYSGTDWWRVRFAASDSDAFAEALDLVKSLPPRQRAYDPERREWRVDPFAMAWLAERWAVLREAWVRARSGEARGWRGTDERSGGTTSRDVTPRDVREAFAALHLLPSAPPEVVKAAFRALAKTLHPDVGGDTAAMVRVNLAYEQSREWARERNGSGHSAA